MREEEITIWWFSSYVGKSESQQALVCMPVQPDWLAVLAVVSYHSHTINYQEVRRWIPSVIIGLMIQTHLPLCEFVSGLSQHIITYQKVSVLPQLHLSLFINTMLERKWFSNHLRIKKIYPFTARQVHSVIRSKCHSLT